jgi:hypothetical protein
MFGSLRLNAYGERNNEGAGQHDRCSILRA